MLRGGVHDIEADALAVMSRHGWPGNVSELVDCVEQACSAAEGEAIRIEDLPATVRDRQHPSGHHDVIPALPPRAPRTPSATNAPRADPRMDTGPDRREIPRNPAPSSREIRPWDITDEDPISLELYERKALLRALDRVGGDRLAAARLLNVGKSTLYRKLKQFGIA